MFAVCCALAANGVTAGAQIVVEVGPTVGYYLALGPAGAGDGPNGPDGFSAPAYGGELTVWTHRRLGVQAQVAVAPTNRREVTNPGGFAGPLSGEVSMGSVQALYDLDRDYPQQFWIGGGLGLVRHSGDAFQSAESPVAPAVTFGVGSTHALTHSLQLTAGASTLLYRYSGIVEPGGLPLPPRFPRNSACTAFGLTSCFTSR